MTTSKHRELLNGAQEYATHTFCSLYTFSVDATDEIFKSFSAMVAKDVKYAVHDGQLFSVTCPKNDYKSFTTFFKIIKEFINTEIGKAPEVFEGIKVTRIKGTTPMDDTPYSAGMTTQSLMLTNGETTTTQTTTENDLPLIEHEAVTRTWSSQGSGKAKLDDFTMSSIGSVCHCRIEWSKESARDVNIIGDTEQDVVKAISKLSVMDKAAIEQMSFPRIISFVNYEGEFPSSFKFRMTALGELREHNDHRGSSTLLSPASRLFRSIEDALVISMVKDNVLIKPNCCQDARKASKENSHITAPERHEDTCENILWKDHPFRSLNAHSGHYHELATLAEPGATTPTQQWVAQVPGPTEMGNPYLPQAKKEIPVSAKVGPKIIEEQYNNPPEPIQVSKPSTKRARAIKGTATKAKPPTIKPSAESNIKEASLSKESLELSTPGLANTGRSGIDLDPLGQAMSKAQDKGTIGAGKLLKIMPGAYKQVLGRENQEPGAEEPLAIVPKEIVVPEITAPYMPPPPSTASGPSAKSSDVDATNNGWEGNIPRGSAGHLLKASTLNERPGRSNMPQPRRTMGQKAPSRALSGGNTALLKDFENSAKQLLDLALSRRGPVIFEVGIGRLLINHQIGSAEFKSKPFSLSEWFSAFPRKSGLGRLETRFTPRLTTSLEDVESILATRLPKARRVFENDTSQQPILRTVNYVFSCKSKQGNQITIVVDEDGAFKIVGGEILVGSLDFHFPKRSWDASLRLRTSSLRSIDYHKQVESIVRNLNIYTWPDQTALNLSTQTVDEELMIQSIVLRRETFHPCKVYADLLLRLCEVQDLQVCKQGHRYDGGVQDRESMIDAGRYWWEASIMSLNANSILEANDKLEIGEIATWDAETIIEKGIVRDLYSLSNDLVTRIDSVGFHNKGLKGNLSTSANTKSIKPSELLPGEGFW